MDDSKPEGGEFDDIGKTPETSDETQKEHDGTLAIGDDELSKIAVAKALGFEKIHDLHKYSDQATTASSDR